MLFSGAAISLAAWGHWVPEHSRPALLSVCPPAHLYLPVFPYGCICALNISIDWWVFSWCVVVHAQVNPRVSEERHELYPGGLDSWLWDSTADNRSFYGRLLGPCSVPIRLLLFPLLAAPVLNVTGEVVEAIKSLSRHCLCHFSTFFLLPAFRNRIRNCKGFRLRETASVSHLFPFLIIPFSLLVPYPSLLCQTLTAVLIQRAAA